MSLLFICTHCNHEIRVRSQLNMGDHEGKKCSKCGFTMKVKDASRTRKYEKYNPKDELNKTNV
jgi:transcription elongation factor Elf1